MFTQIAPKMVLKLHTKARNLRVRSLRMIHAAKSGHPGGSLSAAELVSCLYFHELKVDPKDPLNADRDRFILSKGHAVPVLYAAMIEAGMIPESEELSLRQLGSRLQGHPDRRKLPFVEANTGSLGQGLSIGIGVALAAKMDGKACRTWVMLGDGECDEGQIWEAAMFAGHRKLANLTCIVDYNKIQLDDEVKKILDLEPLADKWRSFGWNAIQIDGHDIEAILKAFAEAREETARPTCIIADTVKGKGVSFMEGQVKFHGVAPTDDELAKALSELGV